MAGVATRVKRALDAPSYLSERRCGLPDTANSIRLPRYPARSQDEPAFFGELAGVAQEVEHRQRIEGAMQSPTLGTSIVLALPFSLLILAVAFSLLAIRVQAVLQ